MNQGKLIFAQLMQRLARTTFPRCVARYCGEHKTKVSRGWTSFCAWPLRS